MYRASRPRMGLRALDRVCGCTCVSSFLPLPCIEPLCIEPLYIGPLFIGPLYIEPLHIEPLDIGPLFIGPRYIGLLFRGPIYTGPLYTGALCIEHLYVGPLVLLKELTMSYTEARHAFQRGSSTWLMCKYSLRS